MRRSIKQGDTATRQRMLILVYQRLFYFLVFKVANENPLLAIYFSGAMSKPLHPQILYYYTTTVHF